ncbi:hypothetical protein HBI56_038640 [Parastagonospora nodorum]|nr:hypothetical protein HBH51_003430 [Parastagonospora nodorum]KAH4040440.1 hypothetical protein HBI09_027980 [Parastagonospora nodorum]KAH4168352.1 hypothetical protein HBH43_122870 [Parastagonospora nodorum]KAH4196664.1 hypothetical protein HBH42_068650 [Parastagonospora nodorum]KAH4205185.1 hypothetical protein HBI95_134550 [Parastagonospora nodorum]
MDHWDTRSLWDHLDRNVSPLFIPIGLQIAGRREALSDFGANVSCDVVISDIDHTLAN